MSYDIACKIYYITKAKKIISKRPRTRALALYKQIHFDLILMLIGLRDNQQIAHFLCDQTQINHVYIIPNKKEETLITCFKDLVQFI